MSDSSRIRARFAAAGLEAQAKRARLAADDVTKAALSDAIFAIAQKNWREPIADVVRKACSNIGIPRWEEARVHVLYISWIN